MRKDDDRFAAAEQLWAEGQFRRAMMIYNDILADESVPRMARAIVSEYLGRLHIGLGEMEKAERFLRRAVEMDPEGMEHHVQLANCLCLAGRNDEAWQMIRRLYRTHGEHPAVMHYMGKMLDERGQHKKGLELMKAAIRLDPHNERFLADLSFAYMMRGNAGAAVVCSEEAMALNPHDEAVRFVHQVAREFEQMEAKRKLKARRTTQRRAAARTNGRQKKASRP